MTTVRELGMPGIGGVPLAGEGQRPRDYKSDADVRWCPGCGDYAVLHAVQSFLPTLGLRRENIVFISGIGCSSRFPYYLDTYGMHSIHGRAPAIATGLACARPDLSVWLVTGDGDALAIGGNHLIHALRRNVNIKILLFDNRVYGLTKGQYSPTSEAGKVTKSSPVGSLDRPLDPISLALGAEAGFVARVLDSDRDGLAEVLGRAAAHRGAALVQILQNCPVFNDGAFEDLKNPGTPGSRQVVVRHGHPIRFGSDPELAIVRTSSGLAVAPFAESAEDAVLVHDTTIADPSYAFALAKVSDAAGWVISGVLREFHRPAYDDVVRGQVAAARENPGDLRALLHGGETWTVGEAAQPV